MLYRKNYLVILLAFILSSFIFVHSSVSQMPVPRDYIVDKVGIIQSNIKQELNNYLQELERKTSAQFLVLIVNTTGRKDIFSYSLEIAESWKLGKKGVDNGLLLVVSVGDKKYYMQVGYGLESVLPDSLAGSICRQYLVPNFRSGDFNKGIKETTLATLNVLAKHYGIEITGMPDVAVGQNQNLTFMSFINSLVILLLIIFLLSRSGPLGLAGLYALGGFSGGRGGGWGGRSGSGGFGSFGGGRGGSFGGGGAGGSW